MFRILFTVAILVLANNSFATQKYVVTLNQYVSHLALDAANAGMQEALTERQMLPDRVDLVIANAQGNAVNNVQIAKHQASLQPRVMVGISTASAQANLKARNSENTIIAFTAVTDPMIAGLSNSSNVIGVTDMPPIKELIKMSMEIWPNLKTVGVIFNPGEVNSIRMVEQLEEILSAHNIKLLKSSIQNSSNIKSSIRALLGKVDIIYLPQDNTVISALGALVNESAKSKTPIIANDPLLVDQGVMIGLGCDYFRSGKQLGFMIADLLEDKKIDHLIQNSSIKELRINEKIAHDLGVNIPDSIKTRGEK